MFYGHNRISEMKQKSLQKYRTRGVYRTNSANEYQETLRKSKVLAEKQ